MVYPQPTKHDPGKPAEHPHTATAIRWITETPELLAYARERRALAVTRGKLLNARPETLVGDDLHLRCCALAGANIEKDARDWPREAPEGVPLSAFLLHHKVNWTEVADKLGHLLRG